MCSVQSTIHRPDIWYAVVQNLIFMHPLSGNWHAGRSYRTAAAAAAALPPPRHGVQASQWGPNGGVVPCFVSDSVRHRRAEVQRVGVRNGPVRRERRERESPDGVFLQQILLLHQHRHSNSSHCSCLHSRRSRAELGLRDLLGGDVDCHLHISLRD